jgi:hypothetical protein
MANTMDAERVWRDVDELFDAGEAEPSDHWWTTQQGMVPVRSDGWDEERQVWLATVAERSTRRS